MYGNVNTGFTKASIEAIVDANKDLGICIMCRTSQEHTRILEIFKGLFPGIKKQGINIQHNIRARFYKNNSGQWKHRQYTFPSQAVLDLEPYIDSTNFNILKIPKDFDSVKGVVRY